MKKKAKKSFFSKVGSKVLGEAKGFLGDSIVSANPFVEVADFVTGGSISDAINSSTEKAAGKLNEMKKKSDSKNKVQKVESKNIVQKDEPINRVKENESNSEYNIKYQKPMYNEKLDKLIEMALMDGELTEKEKQVLFKNAEKEGIDLDEFEMVLEAKLFEKQRSMEQEKPKTTEAAPKSDKYGDVKKCPACGSMIQSFQTKCPDCGHEFSNIEANASIEKLFKMLDEAESQRNDKVTVGGVIGGLFKNTIGGGALSNALGGGSKTDKRKKEIISSFPVPNTKGDILEFLSLAFPKAKPKGNFLTKNNPEYIEHNEFASVWKAKCEQIIMKAKFSMKEDKNALEEIMQYAKELKIK